MSPSAPDGFQVVAISPNMPGSAPAGMNGDFSRMTLMPSPEMTKPPSPDDHSGVAFVKGGKRKRLSKACDACHKSKRRCDGTAPCSNCYFASKECTYTDASGRPVPAPRTTHQDRTATGHPSRISTGQPAESVRSAAYNASSPEELKAGRRLADTFDPSSKRVKPETSPKATSTSPTLDSGHSSPTTDLDPMTQLELINLFFAHCNPHRLIVHKPSFFAALTHERVPQYLVLIICALAAPWCKEIVDRAPMARLAGVPFFQEALSLMFDSKQSLVCEPTLATAQALCLLEMHEVAASHSWTNHYRYFDLAYQVLEDALRVDEPSDPAFLATLDPVKARLFNIERECTRRCFWLIQTMNWINGIYTYRHMRPRSVEIMKVLPLPVDENSFELGKSTPPEYLHIPGPHSKTASQFGHVCRTLSMYQALEAVLANKDVQSRPPAIAECREAVQTWVASLPEHLRFSQANLDKQIDMFETGATSAAWCYCFMHTLHPCFILELMEAEGTLQAEPIGWIRDQLDRIFKATGHRAKNTILSACTLWTYSKFYPNDPQVQEWDDAFEKLWGFRVTLVAEQWRKTQHEQQAQIGRTYPVESVSQHDSSPAFAVASTDDSDDSPPSRQTSRSEPSSARTSPRDTHTTAAVPRAAHGGVNGTSPSQRQHQHHHQHAHTHAHAPTHHHNHNHTHAHTHTHHHHHRHHSQDDIRIPGTIIPHAQNTAVLGAGGRTLHSQQSLPSLKASGLLEAWKPTPADGYGQPGASARGDERAMHPMPGFVAPPPRAVTTGWRHDGL